jgi:hypothetical protein
VVLHLEGVALEAGWRRTARRGLVAERADVGGGLPRVDEFREASVRGPAVRVGHGEGCAGHALQGVEHDKAGAVGGKVGLGRALGREAQEVRAGLDPRCVAQGPLGRAAGRPVGNVKAVPVLLDAKILDLRRRRPPTRVAHHEGDGANDLDVAETEIAELAVLQFRTQRASAHPAGFPPAARPSRTARTRSGDAPYA